jgi:glycine dehydrogenase subunit 1
LLALRATVYLTALGPQGLKETAELCARKAHYAAEQLTKLPGVKLAFDRPFFKEFTLRVPGDAKALLAGLVEDGYLAGLPLGRYFPKLADCVSIAVTEKRTKAEIDGLAAAVGRRLVTLGASAGRVVV